MNNIEEANFPPVADFFDLHNDIYYSSDISQPSRKFSFKTDEELINFLFNSLLHKNIAIIVNIEIEKIEFSIVGTKERELNELISHFYLIERSEKDKMKLPFSNCGREENLRFYFTTSEELS